jgi:1-aminocyclopropane-1-carboxylate deaminase/D-cysteine desulfhydrase-like pyridoxal-dependent ACC family enzyme
MPAIKVMATLEAIKIDGVIQLEPTSTQTSTTRLILLTTEQTSHHCSVVGIPILMEKAMLCHGIAMSLDRQVEQN